MIKPIFQVFIFTTFILGLVACQNEDPSPEPNQPTNPSEAQGLSASTEVTDSQGNRYEVGFNQGNNNQNPFVVKKNANGNEIWRHIYESTGVDGRATLVSLGANDQPWVVFTMDGGSNDGGYITRKHVESDAFSGVYMNSYGRGGGPKVSIITQLDPNSGKIIKGSFITARLNSGNTNSLSITKFGFHNGQVAFETSSAAWPPGTGNSYERFPNIDDSDRASDNSFKIYYEMNLDLSGITQATLLQE